MEIHDEENVGNRLIPIISRQPDKPKDGEGYTWKGFCDDPLKPKRRTGWMRVSTNPEPPDTETLPLVDPQGKEITDFQIPLPEPKKD